MIEKFSEIKNLAVFADFNWDNEVLENGRSKKLEKINILYGRNYSGKTTLSRILRALETGALSDKYDNPLFTVTFKDGYSINQSKLTNCTTKIRVFNEDFVKDNLRFFSNPDDSITPFAILGEDNNNTEKQIKDLENQLGVEEPETKTGLYEQLESQFKKYTKAKVELEKAEGNLEKLLKEKATGNPFGIKYNFEKFGDQNYNKTKLLSDITKVTRETYRAIDSKTKSDLENLLAEKTKVEIRKLPDTNLFFKNFCELTEELITKKIAASDKIMELLMDAALNDWVKKGFELHQNRSSCIFCDNPITDDRWQVLFRHFDEETKKLEDDIDSLLLKIDREIQVIETGFNIDIDEFYLNFQEDIQKLLNEYEEWSFKYINELNQLKDLLKARKSAITKQLNFVYPKDHQKEIINIWSQYEGLRIKSNEFTSNLNSEQNKAKNTLRLHEVFEFVKTSGYESAMEHIKGLKDSSKSAKDTMEETKKDILEVKTKIQELKRQLNDEERGAIKVNEYLSNFFGHSYLSLQAVEESGVREKKIRFEIVREGKRAFHLSEGECSLIAFCYFMAKLDEVDIRDSNPIIWVDDPISSLDGNHIFFVYSLLLSEIVNRGTFEQLFISTHNLEFLKYLRRLNGKEGKKNYQKAYFQLIRSGKESTIQIMPKYLREYATEFNYLFQEIYNCSRMETIDDSNFASFYNFGNNARKFLEVFLYYKYPDFTDDLVKLERFFGEGLVPAILTDRMNNEYSHLSGNLERGSLPIEVPEMRSVAKLIINKLKEDEDQFTAFMNSIGNPEQPVRESSDALVPV